MFVSVKMSKAWLEAKAKELIEYHNTDEGTKDNDDLCLIDSVNDGLVTFNEEYRFDSDEQLQLIFSGKDKTTGKNVISVYASINDGDFKTNDLLKVRQFGSSRLDILKEKLVEVLKSL